MTISTITSFLESVAPLHLQESYDNAGLITGHPDWEVQSVLVSLDTTPDIVDEAIARKCNLIVAHHPIVFKGLKKINGLNYVEKAVIKAIKNDIGIYAIHTNLDNIYLNGVNRKIADKLGLKHTRILSPKNADNPEIGSGIIGELETPVPTKKFLEHLKISMKAGCIRHTPIVLDHVQKIALCGGSGSFLINKAIEEKADIYISGDIKYHEFFDANDQLIIADIGHYESEQYTIELIIELLTAEFSNFAAHFTNLNTNPINYF